MTKEKTYNPIFSRAGGKARMLKYLLPLIPPHVCYVELFAGGAALLRAKSRSKVEVLNDIDGNIVNAFRSCRFHADELVREMEGTINSRRDFYDCLDQPGLTDIQRAARWLFANSVSFGGDNHSFAVGKDEGGGAVKSQVNLRSAIRELSMRLDKVAIEDLDWRKCIENYDAPETFFFCDPPYVGGSISQYGAWSQGAMADFAIALQRIKGKWLLTVNDSPSNRKLFSFAHEQRITTMNQTDLWMLVATIVMAIGTAVMAIIMWVDRRKRTEVHLQPQPVRIAIDEELHRKFAAKDAFEAHCVSNDENRAALHARIDKVVDDYNAKFQNLPGEIVALLRHTGALKP